MDGSGGAGDQDDEESFSIPSTRRFGGNYHHEDGEAEEHEQEQEHDRHFYSGLAYDNAEEDEDGAGLNGGGGGKFSIAVPHDSLWFEHSPPKDRNDDAEEDDNDGLDSEAKEGGDHGGRNSRPSSAAFATPQSSSPHSLRQAQIGDSRRIPEAHVGGGLTRSIMSVTEGGDPGGNNAPQTPLDYTSSESEEDRTRTQHHYRYPSSNSLDANGQRSTIISSFPTMGGRQRRDSGLPPIQLTAAKRLPHYPLPPVPSMQTSAHPGTSAATTPTPAGAANKSTSATSLVSAPVAIEEEEEEEEEDDEHLQQQRLRRELQQQYSNEHLNRRHQQQYSQSEDMDSEDIVESLEIREREIPPIQPRPPTTQPTSSAKKPPVTYSEPPDRGPADLSNPSLALAEALIAARAQAENRKNATAAANTQGSLNGTEGSGTGTGVSTAGANDTTTTTTITSRHLPSSSADSPQKTTVSSSKDRLLQQQNHQRQPEKPASTLSVPGPSTGTPSSATSPSAASPQVRIPVPHLSPMLRSQQSPWEGHQLQQPHQQQSTVDRGMDPSVSGRSPESLQPIAMVRRTSFTLSPTSSNPELGHSQTDSHSGESLMAAHLIRRGSQDYRHRDSQLGSSYDSNRYDRGGAHHQPRCRDSPSYSSASSPPTHNHLNHRQGHTRFLFPGRDVDQQSVEEEEMPHYDHPARRRSSQHQQYHHHSHFRDSSLHSRYESSINDELDDPFRPPQRSLVPRQQQHHNHHRGHQTSASEASAYPFSTSSIEESHDEATHSRHLHHHRRHQGETEDEDHDHDHDHDDEEEEDAATTSSAAAHRIADDEQLRAETEYIMSRNAELLKILAIRDEEIQTLQQELDHTLKIMHEYENDLMEMHTAAAQPYESYHQTLDEIGREMTQQDALLKGYKEENEKLSSQCRSLVNIRNEAEKRHQEKVEELRTEMDQLQQLLDQAIRQQKQAEAQGSSLNHQASVNDPATAAAMAELQATVTRLEALREQERSSYLDKEEEYLAEIAVLKERLAVLEKVLQDEKRNKVEDIQRLERNFQDVRDGYDDMVEQVKSLGVGVSLPLSPPPLTLTTVEESPVAAVNTTTPPPTKVSARPLLLHRESSSDDTSSATSSVKHNFGNNRKVTGASTPVSGIHSRGSASSTSLHHQSQTPPLPPNETTGTKSPSTSASRVRVPDRKLTSTETLTTSNMPKVMAELGLDQRISRFEADIRQSLMRSSSMDSFASVQSSNASNAAGVSGTNAVAAGSTMATSPANHVGSTTTTASAPTSTGPTTSAASSSSSSVVVSQRPSGEQLRPASAAESQALANKLRDRINVLNAENQRLHQELTSLSQAMRQQQAERQRKVKQLEDLLDLHESVAEKKLMEDRANAAANAAVTNSQNNNSNNTVDAAGQDNNNSKAKKDPSSDPTTVEGQQRIRKIIQGLLVRIRTKEAEAEFYHNAYLDKVLELDQLALKAATSQPANANINKGLLFSPVQGATTMTPGGDPMPVSPLSPLSDQAAAHQLQQQQQQHQQQQQQQQAQLQQQQQTISALENRVMELEQANLELTIRLQVEQRRAQARESENTALTREKLVLARLLEDQIEELKQKLASTEQAHQKLLEENATLRERGAKDAAAVAANASATSGGTKPPAVKNEALEEQLTILRARMSSLTRQRDQLREQLQEALDIQLTMSQEAGAGNGAGSGATPLKSSATAAGGHHHTNNGRNEWTVDDYKRLEKALEEKTTELCLWKERAIALEKVVERIRMIKVKPDVFGPASTTTGSSVDRRSERATSDHDSETSSVSVASSSSNVDLHHSSRHTSSSQRQQQQRRRSHGGGCTGNSKQQRAPLSHTLEELDQIVLKLEQRLERRDQELREVVLEAKRQTDTRLEQWKAKWVQVVQRKNAEIRRFQVELEALMKAVDRDRQRMLMAQQQQQQQQQAEGGNSSGSGSGSGVKPLLVGGSKLRSGNGIGPGMHLSSHQDDYDDDHDLVS
ncbi:hypothetical protein BGZ73_001668 [Actinomortierella ambigua]|nr:hypothetical protein BGZ73_001668 [Actinomortierella ambigua]